MIQKRQVVEETILLEEIRQNGMKKLEVIKELEKGDSQSWGKNKIIYINRRIYIPNNQKLQEKILQENHDPVDIRYLWQH